MPAIPSPDDRSLIERDPQLPGLRLLLDDQQAGELLRDQFPERTIRQVRCDYVRYKPATSCLARFTAETDRGPHLFHAIAYRLDANDKLHKAEARIRTCRDRALPAIVSQQAVVIYPFPTDSALPAIAQLTTMEGMSLFAGQLSGLEAWAEIQLPALRYKPRRRLVARVTQSGRQDRVIRIYAGREYRQARRVTKSLAGTGLPVVPCLGRSGHHRAMVFQWAPGSDIQALTEGGQEMGATLEATGATLARIHQTSLGKLRISDVEATLTRLQETSNYLSWLLPDDGPRVSRLARRLSDRLASSNLSATHLIHGDFSPSQVLADREQITFLDFDRACISTPAQDFGSFLAALEAQVCAGQLLPASRDTMMHELMQGYAATGVSVDGNAVALYGAAALLGVTAAPFRYRCPTWRTAARHLLDRVAQLTDCATADRFYATASGFRSGAFAPSGRVKVDDPFLVDKDAKMRFLRSATSPDVADRVLAEAIHPENPDAVELMEIEVLRLKPQRRCLIRYELYFADQNRSLHVFGKSHAKLRQQKSFDRQRALWQAGFQTAADDGISVARPVGTVPQWQMWLQERVPGKTAWTAFAGANPQQTAARIAEAAHKLHTASLPAEREHTISDELAILNAGLQRLAHDRPELTRRLDQLQQGCAGLASSIPEVRAVGIHRDFHPEQVLVHGRRLFVLDHDLYCLGDPSLDIGNFCGHLVERGIRRADERPALDAARQALMDRYLDLNPDASRHVIQAYAILTVARHVYLCQRYADRQDNVLEILQHCEQLLDDPPI